MDLECIYIWILLFRSYETNKKAARISRNIWALSSDLSLASICVASHCLPSFFPHCSWVENNFFTCERYSAEKYFQVFEQRPIWLLSFGWLCCEALKTQLLESCQQLFSENQSHWRSCNTSCVQMVVKKDLTELTGGNKKQWLSKPNQTKNPPQKKNQIKNRKEKRKENKMLNSKR